MHSLIVIQMCASCPENDHQHTRNATHRGFQVPNSAGSIAARSCKLKLRLYTLCGPPMLLEFVLLISITDHLSHKQCTQLSVCKAGNCCCALIAVCCADLQCQGPFTYEALPPDQINFVPLKQTREFKANDLMQVRVVGRIGRLHWPSNPSHAKHFLTCWCMQNVALCACVHRQGCISFRKRHSQMASVWPLHFMAFPGCMQILLMPP